MFESITQRLTAAFDRLRGHGRLSEENIREGLREVRMALLEADVNVQVVRDLMSRVTEKAVGQETIQEVSPAQQIVKVFHDALIDVLGPGDSSIPKVPGGPTIILMAGLQGSGKTTTCGKLALYLARKGRRPLLVAADVQRPAAVEQLRQVGEQVGVPVHSRDGVPPPQLCEEATRIARERGHDVVILDTAGRLHLDEQLMQELQEIARRARPHQRYLVADAMTGQDAVNSARQFHERLGLDGLVLTKLDGDSKGGAALSVRAVTGCPIKFVGVGEKLDALEEFHPERMVSRILGMGDVVTLVEKAREAMDADKAADMRQRLLDATFDLNDFLEQLRSLEKMGNVRSLLQLIPGASRLPKEMTDVSGDDLRHARSILQSMTPEERRQPELIKGRRKTRIATGSGHSVMEVNSLLRQFQDMRKAMKTLGKQAGQKERRRPGDEGLALPRAGGQRRAQMDPKRKKARRKQARRSRRR